MATRRFRYGLVGGGFALFAALLLNDRLSFSPTPERAPAQVSRGPLHAPKGQLTLPRPRVRRSTPAISRPAEREIRNVLMSLKTLGAEDQQGLEALYARMQHIAESEPDAFRGVVIERLSAAEAAPLTENFFLTQSLVRFSPALKEDAAALLRRRPPRRPLEDPFWGHHSGRDIHLTLVQSYLLDEIAESDRLSPFEKEELVGPVRELIRRSPNPLVVRSALQWLIDNALTSDEEARQLLAARDRAEDILYRDLVSPEHRIR